MTRQAKCPTCKEAARGTNPAGRCDECHATVIAERLRQVTEREERVAAEKAERELRKTCCTDCLAEGREPKKCRPVDPEQPGRRCFTHGKAAKKLSRKVAHARRVEVGYGITGEQYWALYEAQGGKCALCQVATGRTKNLAVDHDHKMAAEVCGHDPKQGCTQCVRGLLCGPCNTSLIIHPVETLVRAINYRHDPPAQGVLARFANLDLPADPEPDSDPPVATVGDFWSYTEDWWAWTPLNA